MVPSLRISVLDPAVLKRIIPKVAGDDAVRGALLVDSGGFQHGRVYRLAERKVRQDQREAVLQTAPHAHTARHGMRRHRRRDPRKCRRPSAPACDGGRAPGGVLGATRPTRPTGASRTATSSGTAAGGRSPTSSPTRGIKGFTAGAEMSGFGGALPGGLPPDTAPPEQRLGRLPVREGAARQGRARHQGKAPVGGSAANDHLLQPGLCLRPRRGGGNLRGHVGGCARLPADRHWQWLRRAPGARDPPSAPSLPADPGAPRASGRAAGWFFWTQPFNPALQTPVAINDFGQFNTKTTRL